MKTFEIHKSMVLTDTKWHDLMYEMALQEQTEWTRMIFLLVVISQWQQQNDELFIFSISRIKIIIHLWWKAHEFCIMAQWVIRKGFENCGTSDQSTNSGTEGGTIKWQSPRRHSNVTFKSGIHLLIEEWSLLNQHEDRKRVPEPNHQNSMTIANKKLTSSRKYFHHLKT